MWEDLQIMSEEVRQLAASIVETVREPLVVLDGNLRVQFANRAFYKTFQVTSQEAEGILFFNLGSGQWNIPELRALLCEILPHRAEVEDFEIACDFPVIGRKVMRLNARRLDDEARRMPLILLAIEDVTERERAAERIRQLIEGAPNGMVMVDRQGQMVLVNVQIEQSFGYRRDELLGQPIEMLVPPRFRTHHAAYRQSFGTGPVARPMGAGRDLYGLHQDGSEFPVEIGLNPIETDQGLMVLGTIVDITERKRAEQTLRRSQEQLAGVIGSAMDAIITVGGDQRIVLFNAAAERMFRCPPEAAIGQTLDRFIPERFRATHQGHIQSFGRTNVSRRTMGALGAIFGLRADGEEFPIEASISQLESEGQKFYTVILRDITERKRAEEALRASEARFSIAFTASPISSVIATLDEGRYVAVNDTFLSLTGYRREEVIGRTSADLRVWPTMEARAEVIQLLRTQGRINNRETRYQVNNGEVRVFLMSAEIIELDGQPHLITASIDITERKRAEEAIREQAQILNLAPVLIRDMGGRLLFWNTGAEQMYGWKPEEALGKITHHLLHTEFPQPLEEIEATVLAQGYWKGEIVHTRRDGGRLMIASHWVLHRKELGEQAVILEVNSDITERKQAEEEIRRLNEELEQRVAERTAQLQTINKELEAFSYSVSHDLRAPLRHINGFSQALLEDYADHLDEEGKYYLQEVRGASKEMAQLIDDLLQLARVTRSEMRRETVNLSEIAQAVMTELQRTDTQRSLEIRITEGLVTHGDKRLLQVLLNNLLGNAWKFTARRQAAEIIFGQEQQNGEAVYFVRDNGAGFDMAYVNKLFGAFQRLHSGREFEGTGIGLATVQRIVRRHGGRVWAEGEVNQGATFYFTLTDFKETDDGG
jgi:PAS domain S-box-containing protein